MSLKRFIVLILIALVLALAAPPASATPAVPIEEGDVNYWYDDLHLDQDKNRIDDTIDSYIQNPQGSKLQAFIDMGYLNPDDIPVFVVYEHRPGDGDIDALKALGDNIESGVDKIKAVYPELQYEIQLEHAQKIGIGSRDYELIRI